MERKGKVRVIATDLTTDSIAMYDLDFDNPDMVKAMVEVNNFWSDSDSRLLEHDGDVVKAFIDFLTKEIFMMSISGRWWKERIIREFETKEGFFNLDGSWGVELIKVDILDDDWMKIQMEGL